MNTSRFKATGSRARTAWSALVAVGMAILFSATALAQAPAAAGGAAPPPPAGDLAQLVGRIALYPDDLVAIILPAATSPLQIVQADRYLDKRKSDPTLPIDDKWDDPVKSLLNYPDVVKMMSNDLDWTSALGEAVVADQGAVLESVQVFRRQAKSAGNLKTDTKQVVKTEREVIIIEPADPQVIYVPQYNPSTVVVYGAPAWGYYPTPYPSYYYPYAPGAAMAAGVIWGAAIGAAWSGNHYGWGGGNDININRNTNISTGGNTINRGQGGQASQWKSNKQPGQVSSSVGKTAPTNRAGDARGGAGASAGGGARASTQPAGGADRGGAGAGGDRAGAGAGGGARPSTQPAGGGSRGGGGDSAFGGYDSGRQTQMDSSRGASSRGSSSYGGGGGSRPTASTGASKSYGGGGGAARGGGGGGRGGGGRR